MKIVVCVKQVPDTKGGVKFNPDGTLDRGAMLTIMNPDDKAGLEAALRLKDQYGAEVTVVTMGLPKAEEVLREAMAMGADKGIIPPVKKKSHTYFLGRRLFFCSVSCQDKHRDNYDDRKHTKKHYSGSFCFLHPFYPLFHWIEHFLICTGSQFLLIQIDRI